MAPIGLIFLMVATVVASAAKRRRSSISSSESCYTDEQDGVIYPFYLEDPIQPRFAHPPSTANIMPPPPPLGLIRRQTSHSPSFNPATVVTNPNNFVLTPPQPENEQSRERPPLYRAESQKGSNSKSPSRVQQGGAASAVSPNQSQQQPQPQSHFPFPKMSPPPMLSSEPIKVVSPIPIHPERPAFFAPPSKKVTWDTLINLDKKMPRTAPAINQPAVALVSCPICMLRMAGVEALQKHLQVHIDPIA